MNTPCPQDIMCILGRDEISLDALTQGCSLGWPACISQQSVACARERPKTGRPRGPLSRLKESHASLVNPNLNLMASYSVKPGLHRPLPREERVRLQIETSRIPISWDNAKGA